MSFKRHNNQWDSNISNIPYCDLDICLFNQIEVRFLSIAECIFFTVYQEKKNVRRFEDQSCQHFFSIGPISILLMLSQSFTFSTCLVKVLTSFFFLQQHTEYRKYFLDQISNKIYLDINVFGSCGGKLFQCFLLDSRLVVRLKYDIRAKFPSCFFNDPWQANNVLSHMCHRIVLSFASWQRHCWMLFRSVFINKISKFYSISGHYFTIFLIASEIWINETGYIYNTTAIHYAILFCPT